MTFEENARICDERKVAKAKEYADQSKQRLKKIAATKVRTTFIGALSEFEKAFGFLWGAAENPNHVSDPESIQIFRQLWDTARTAILNNGNTQMRGLDQEISQYSMTWGRYKITMPVKDGQ